MKMKETGVEKRLHQCQKPSGWLGRLVVWNMNSRHSKLTDWGLSHVSIKPGATILDVGCGGGKTVSKLAGIANRGRVYGVDYSDVSVGVARRLNAGWIDKGRVEIREGTVSELPFPNETFEIVTAVETHFWWPDLTLGLREVRRVLKPGGTALIVAEVYKGATTRMAKLVEQYAPKTGIKLLSIEEHRDLLVNAGYTEVQIIEDANRGWLCGLGKKPPGEESGSTGSGKTEA
jgi:ubiquinone/menaquinone biosynthesis C-methylase UbiE